MAVVTTASVGDPFSPFSAPIVSDPIIKAAFAALPAARSLSPSIALFTALMPLIAAFALPKLRKKLDDWTKEVGDGSATGGVTDFVAGTGTDDTIGSTGVTGVAPAGVAGARIGAAGSGVTAFATGVVAIGSMVAGADGTISLARVIFTSSGAPDKGNGIGFVVSMVTWVASGAAGTGSAPTVPVIDVEGKDGSATGRGTLDGLDSTTDPTIVLPVCSTTDCDIPRALRNLGIVAIGSMVAGADGTISLARVIFTSSGAPDKGNGIGFVVSMVTWVASGAAGTGSAPTVPVIDVEGKDGSATGRGTLDGLDSTTDPTIVLPVCSTTDCDIPRALRNLGIPNESGAGGSTSTGIAGTGSPTVSVGVAGFAAGVSLAGPCSAAAVFPGVCGATFSACAAR